MTAHLLGAYVIGSVARGEADALSDLDVLAIVQDGRGKVPESKIHSLIPPDISGPDIGISWYGIKRIRQMFENGELFAWHIWREHMVLAEQHFSLADLGPPAEYKNALLDIQSFERILAGSPVHLSEAPGNAVYEFGLLYVCLRNIGMSASAILKDWPDFSRYSPFKFNEIVKLPMSIEDYNCAMQCRMAGQRGITPPESLDAEFVQQCYKDSLEWVGLLKEIVRAQR